MIRHMMIQEMAVNISLGCWHIISPSIIMLKLTIFPWRAIACHNLVIPILWTKVTYTCHSNIFIAFLSNYNWWGDWLNFKIKELSGTHQTGLAKYFFFPKALECSFSTSMCSYIHYSSPWYCFEMCALSISWKRERREGARILEQYGRPK